MRLKIKNHSGYTITACRFTERNNRNNTTAEPIRTWNT